MMRILDDDHDDTERLALLLKCLSQLKTEHQQLIELRYFEKHSFKEMGEMLKLTEGNAKIKTYRAIEKLKRLMLA